MKQIEVNTIVDNKSITFDWKNLALIKRIEFGIKLIFYGKIKMNWKKNRFYLLNDGDKKNEK